MSPPNECGALTKFYLSPMNAGHITQTHTPPHHKEGVLSKQKKTQCHTPVIYDTIIEKLDLLIRKKKLHAYPKIYMLLLLLPRLCSGIRIKDPGLKDKSGTLQQLIIVHSQAGRCTHVQPAKGSSMDRKRQHHTERRLTSDMLRLDYSLFLTSANTQNSYTAWS